MGAGSGCPNRYLQASPIHPVMACVSTAASAAAITPAMKTLPLRRCRPSADSRGAPLVLLSGLSSPTMSRVVLVPAGHHKLLYGRGWVFAAVCSRAGLIGCSYLLDDLLDICCRMCSLDVVLGS